MIEQELLNKIYPERTREFSENLITTPVQVFPIVTQSDADSGFITRYFIRPANDKTAVIEINKVQYERFKQNPRFVVVEIRWKIIGKLDTIKYSNGATLFGVKDQNKMEVSKADLTFEGLTKYIVDYGAYWIRE